MPITKEYDFGILEIHDYYVKAVMNEGTTIEPKHNTVLESIAKTYFQDKNFGYITHRLNSYSVDPRVYIETSKIPNLLAFAIVSDNPIKLSNAQVEMLFLKKPFKTFKRLDKAAQWVHKVLEG